MDKIYELGYFSKEILPSVRKDKVVALCHGVFDLVHPGHIVHLQQAKAMADILVVSVTTAKYVNKGPGHPYFDDETRMESLAALACVDYVILSEYPSSLTVLDKLRPELYVKGIEYRSAANDRTGAFKEEKAFVESYGGKVCFSEGKVFSSTKLIDTFLKTDTVKKDIPGRSGKSYPNDKLRLDSHKLIYHPGEVCRWLEGEDIYPIEVEISPSGACNHRCIFCAYDYIGYKPQLLDFDVIMKNIKQMHEKGLKSVVCAGEGEPLLNPKLADMALSIKAMGVDVALSTNGVFFTEEVAKSCLEAFSWIRFSVASLSEESYYRIQQPHAGDLDKVRKNLCDAVKVKQTTGAHTTLGVQCLLMPENRDDVVDMVRQCRDIGVDYISIKPYSPNVHSINHFDIDYEQMEKLENEVRQYETDHFTVSFRINAMRNVQKKKTYEKCLGLPFMVHIDSSGNVWPCSVHIGNEDYCYGNIYEKTFQEIWEGDRRKAVMNRLWSQDIDSVCRKACRLDPINQYLNELKHPAEHVNFI